MYAKLVAEHGANFLKLICDVIGLLDHYSAVGNIPDNHIITLYKPENKLILEILLIMSINQEQNTVLKQEILNKEMLRALLFENREISYWIEDMGAKKFRAPCGHTNWCINNYHRHMAECEDCPVLKLLSLHKKR